MTKLVAPLTCALTLAGVGCVSSSIGSDVSQVRELTKIGRLGDVAHTDVQPAIESGAADEVKQLLREPLDANAAVRIALLNNRELRATLRELGIARGKLMQAGLLPNPRVGVDLPADPYTKLELRVEYDLMGAVLAPLRAAGARHLLQAARFRAAGAVVDLGYRVRVAFYAVQAAEQRLGIAQQSLDALGASRDAAVALHDAGNVRELDASSQEAAYARARIGVALLELEVATERERLQRLIGGRDTDTHWKVRGPLMAVPEQPQLPDGAEQQALRASLELREARARLQALARQAGFSQTKGLLPDVSVHVAGQESHPESGSSHEDKWHYGAGIDVGIPLFDRGQGTTAALSAEFDALLERYYGMAVDVGSAVREATSRVTSAHARARQYEQVIVPAQAIVTAQTLLQYNAMQLGVFQLLAARREEFDVQLAYVETLRAYWSAVAELEAVLAGRRATAMAREAAQPMGLGAVTEGGH